MNFNTTLSVGQQVTVEVVGLDSKGKSGAVLTGIAVTFSDPIGTIFQDAATPNILVFQATGTLGSATAVISANNELGEAIEPATLSITVSEAPTGVAVSISLIISEPTEIV